MEFSEEFIKKLYSIYFQDEPISIRGINSVGQEFRVKGKISRANSGRECIYDDKIYLQFGRRMKRNEQFHTAYSAPYCLNLKQFSDYTCDSTLVIFAIYDKNRNKIFENPNKKEITRKALINRTLEKEKLAKKNLNITEIDPLTKALETMVGKPVVIDGHFGVFVKTNGFDQKTGGTKVELFSGAIRDYFAINNQSILFTEDNKGTLEYVAHNTCNTQKIFNERVLRYQNENSDENE